MTPESHRRRPLPRRAAPAVLLCLVLLAAPALALGPAPPIVWEATFEGEGTPFATDVLSDLAVNGVGEICATGLSAVESGATAAATVYYEPDGTERWRHLYVAPETAGVEEGLAVFLDDTGRCRVAGRRSSAETGPDVLVLEYGPQGDLLWSASWDGETSGGFDVAVDVTADAAGNVYAVALTAGDGTGWDFVTLKVDATGEQLWARTFDGPLAAEDRPVGVEVDADGNVYVAGTASVSNPFADDLVVIKYDPDGNELWSELLDGGVGGADKAAALALDADGHPYVAARLLQPPGAEWQAGVVKLLPDGSHDWTGTFGHPAAGIPEDVRGLALGIDGAVTVLATGSDDVVTGRFDAAGTLVWDHLHDNVSIADLAARPLAVDSDGNAYVVAYDFVPDRGYDFFTYRLEAADGAFAWGQTFGEEGEEADDFPGVVAVDARGDLLVGGTVKPGGITFENDWTILKYGASQLFADGFETGDTSAWSSTSG